MKPIEHTYESLEETKSVDPEQVKKLRLHGKFSKIFPEEIFKFTKLESLYLDSYDCEIPEKIGDLEHIRYLRISSRTIRSIPTSVRSLSNLETLAINECPLLLKIPDEIAELEKLELLCITQNRQLTRVPESICSLNQLKSLDLRWNQLTTLPENIGHLSKLERIELKGNAFKSLPKSLSNVKSVELEQTVKALYQDISYTSRNPNPIDEKIFLASQDDTMVSRIDSLLGSSPINHHRDALLAIARKSVCLTTTEVDENTEMGVTRLGGAPDLPPSIIYPEQEGKLFLFLAQINFNEIHHLQEFLPRKGILYFFVSDLEFVEEAKTIFWNGEKEELVRFSYPQCSEEELSIFIDSDHEEPFPASSVKLSAQPSFPLLYSDNDRLPENAISLLEIEQHDDQKKKYSSILDELGPEKNDRHWINSFVFTQHESPEERASEKMGGYASEWMNLLSLSYDQHTGFDFWDAGTLTFTIHKKDLAIADFSNVVVNLESS